MISSLLYSSRCLFRTLDDRIFQRIDACHGSVLGEALVDRVDCGLLDVFRVSKSALCPESGDIDTLAFNAFSFALIARVGDGFCACALFDSILELLCLV
jgi:hypothetical protein